MRLRVGVRDLYVDLGAELVGAEKDSVRIAVEIKGFLEPSVVSDLEQAVFEEPIGQLVLGRLKVLVFDPMEEEVEKWTPNPPIVK